MLTPTQLASAAQYVVDRTPEATLIRNIVGNLSIVDGMGDYIGWIDLQTGRVTYINQGVDVNDLKQLGPATPERGV